MERLNQNQEKWMSPSAFKQAYRSHLAWRQVPKLRELRDAIAKLPEGPALHGWLNPASFFLTFNTLGRMSKSWSGEPAEKVRALLAGKPWTEFVKLVVSLAGLERLLTARQIAEASGVAKRHVPADMKAGPFVDPIFGAGFFCRAPNSLRVNASAATARRQAFAREHARRHCRVRNELGLNSQCRTFRSTALAPKPRHRLDPF